VGRAKIKNPLALTAPAGRWVRI